MKATRIYDPFNQGFPSGLLHHYASQDGIKGIVGERNLWATNIEYLNDLSEFEHGAKIIKKAIAERIAQDRADERSFFAWVEPHPPTVEPHDVFVISLSEEPDLLSQWRGYTPSNRGFSIGFDPAVLAKIAWKIDHMMLVRCVYDESKKQDLINSLIESCIAEWRSTTRLDEKGREWGELSAASRFITRSQFAAAAMKDSSFKEEREWRLVGVCRDAPRFKFRNGSSALTPYIELKWGKGTRLPGVQPIRSVTIGPCPNSQLSAKSVARLLNSNGVTDAKVLESEIPFRSW